MNGGGRTCTICRQPTQDAIDRELLLAQKTRAEIARKFGVSVHALGRHEREGHVAPGVPVEVRARMVVDRAEELAQRIEHKLAEVEQKGSPASFAAVVRELRATLELIGRLRRELDDRPQVNVLVLPEWHQVRQAMLGALAAFPEARAAVAHKLLELEAS